MSRGTRSHIRRAARLGLDVRRGDSWQDLVAFAHLGEQTKKRLMVTKGLPPSGESPEMRAAALQTLVARGAGRLYVASLGGRPLAGCFFGIWDGSAYYLQNGADVQAQRYDAVHFALHGAITDFMADGFTRVNLGAVPADGRDESSIDHGLYNFKLRLGTQPIPCTGGSLVIRPARARALSVARHHRDLLRSIRGDRSLSPWSRESSRRPATLPNSAPGGQ
jgi:lipid II:glycine glycyltransferase (peptidoglycan interpeptide bridge formation enzyme)